MHHLPNLITLLRALLALPLCWYIARSQWSTAAGLLLIAAASDVLDGALAKRFAWHSELGAWLDPAADKILLIACYVALAWVQAVPMAFLILLLVRDIGLVAGSLILHRHHLRPEPSALGRACTLAQTVLALAVIAQGAAGLPAVVSSFLLLIATLLTVASGIHYVAAALRRLSVARASDDR